MNNYTNYKHSILLSDHTIIRRVDDPTIPRTIPPFEYSTILDDSTIPPYSHSFIQAVVYDYDYD